MQMKTCFKCGQRKLLEMFYHHPQMSQGTLNKCKECTRLDAALRREQMLNDPAWIAKERERCRRKQRTFAKRQPVQSRAYTAIREAKRKGKLKPQPCEVCGEPKTQAHHDDYNRPLDVRWLCVKHHAEHHVNARLAQLAMPQQMAA
jgi:hypothetical protein